MQQETGRSSKAGFSRRRALGALAVAAGSAAFMAARERSAGAADGDDLTIGSPNTGTTRTTLTTSVNDQVLRLSNQSNGATSAGLGVWLNTGGAGTLGNSIGVFAKNDKADSYGVWGEANGAGGTALRALAAGNAGVGLKVDANGQDAKGIVVNAPVGAGSAVEAKATFIGIYGEATSNDEGGVGIHGKAKFGYGLRGESQTGFGVSGNSLGPNGLGVFGANLNFGNADGPGGVGVRGRGAVAGVIGDAGRESAGKDGPGVGVFGMADLATFADDPISTAGGMRAGVAGTSSTLGVAGIGGGADVAETKSRTAPAGVMGVGLGDGSSGVYGVSLADDGIAVEATAKAGVGLAVTGANRFSQARKGQFEIGRRTAAVTGLVVNPASGVVGSLNTIAGKGVYLQNVRYNAATNRVVLQLNGPAKRPARFTVFVLDEIV